MKKPASRIYVALVFIFYFPFISGCGLFFGRHGLARISPAPALINSAAGYFSFKLEKEGSIMRGRAFFLLVPGRGRLEILDPVGRLVLLALWSRQAEYLILPSERAYWTGSLGGSRLMAELIGLPLDPVEVLVWIVGQGKGLTALAGELNLAWALSPHEDRNFPGKTLEPATSGWQVEWAETGKLRRGQRNGLKIEVQEYFEDKGVARVLKFTHGSVSGRITVLGLDFNQNFSAQNFQPDSFLEKGYRALSWEEMKSFLRLD
jgi:hypothetical protein